MKPLFAVWCAGVLVAGMTTVAAAQTGSSGQATTQAQNQQAPAQKPLTWGPYFVDANGDGVCDNWPGPGRRWGGQGRGMGGRWIAQGGQAGVQGTQGAQQRPLTWGPYFVDANGDGVCDNWPGPGRRWGGQGRGMGGRWRAAVPQGGAGQGNQPQRPPQ